MAKERRNEMGREANTRGSKAEVSAVEGPRPMSGKTVGFILSK